MINLPSWANPFLNDKKCPHCQSLTHVHGVIGIGVRQRDHKEENPLKGDFLLTFEYMCHSCSKKSLWIADPVDNNLDLIDILEQIISMYSKNISSQQKMSKSKISDKEVELLKKFLHNNKSYEEFLKYLGIETEN